MIYWYTKSNGQLYLGNKKNDDVDCEWATELFLEDNVQFPLTEEHVKTIGSYPEDWSHDKRIVEKINAAAKIFMTERSNSQQTSTKID